MKTCPPRARARDIRRSQRPCRSRRLEQLPWLRAFPPSVPTMLPLATLKPHSDPGRRITPVHGMIRRMAAWDQEFD